MLIDTHVEGFITVVASSISYESVIVPPIVIKRRVGLGSVTSRTCGGANLS